MSHFTVLVIGPDPDRALAPFHEFECTGKNDEYVQEFDRTLEARAEYEAQTVRKLRAPDGTLHDRRAPQFFREPTPEEREEIGPFGGTGGGNGISWDSRDWGDGLGYRTKVHFVPEGYEEVVVPKHEERTFLQFVQGWYGWAVLGEHAEPDREGEHKYGWVRARADGTVLECIDRTNPNAKWDWYQIGGRWQGFFKLKPGAKGAVGESSWASTPVDPLSGVADMLRKGDIDWEAMRSEAEERARRAWQRAHDIIRGRAFTTWPEMLERYPDDIERARREYREQPVIQEWNLSREFGPFDGPENYLQTEEEAVAEGRLKAGVTFAVVKDGQWYERGKMGWWAVVSDEKPEGEWEREYHALIDSLPDDALLTVVDCHI